MSDKNKKILYISLFALDIALTIALFIISIIMLVKMPQTQTDRDNATGIIGYFVKNPTVFLVSVVLPLFILLGVNIYVMIWYVRKQNKAKKVEVSDLSDEDKAKLRAELMKDLQNEDTSNKEDKKE